MTTEKELEDEIKKYVNSEDFDVEVYFDEVKK